MIELIEWEDEVLTLDSIGPMLRKYRLRKDYSVKQFAEKSDMSYATILSAECGGNVTIHTLLSMLDALGYELIAREKK